MKITILRLYALKIDYVILLSLAIERVLSRNVVFFCKCVMCGYVTKKDISNLVADVLE